MKHKPRKRFGQNFLQDSNVIEQIIGLTQAKSGQHWVEIGPGQGALTQSLLATGVQLDIIELDRDLVALLAEKYQKNNNIRIHSADVLTFDFTKLAQPDEQLHIIGNLPYNISTPLMFHLLQSSLLIKAMYFMLQKEVVERICANSGSKKFGRLSVIMQYYCATQYLFEVAPESFSPQPKVISAVFKLEPRQHLPLSSTNLNNLNLLTKQAFSQRRKTIRNSLTKLISKVDIASLDIDPNLRAEDLSLDDFIRLSRKIET